MTFDGRIISGITVFVGVAEAGNYARAAANLGLSRSGVGKSIARLEERTGLCLFDRTSRAIKLTDEGRSFLEEVAPLLDRLGKAAAPSSADAVRGHLRIGADSLFGPFLLVPALTELVGKHPKLRVDVLVRDRIDNMLLEGIDAVIKFGEPEFPDVYKKPIFTSRVITCASAEYIERHGLPASPTAILDGHSCVNVIDKATGRPFPWSYQSPAGDWSDIAPVCNVVVNDAASLLAALHAGSGLVRLLDFMVDADIRSGRVVEVLSDWNSGEKAAYIFLRNRAHRSAGLQAFLEFAEAYAFGDSGRFRFALDRASEPRASAGAQMKA